MLSIVSLTRYIILRWSVSSGSSLCKGMRVSAADITLRTGTRLRTLESGESP